MTFKTAGQFLVVLLQPRVAITLLEQEPGPTLEVGDATFRGGARTGVEGFYDWLRHSTGSVIGVRYTPVDDIPELFQVAPNLPHARMTSGGAGLEIFFAESREFEPAESMDQAFGGSSVYRDDTGRLALSFDTYLLSEAELRSVRQWLLPR